MTHNREDFTATDVAEWLGTQPEPAAPDPQDAIVHLAQRARAALHALHERHRLRREFEALDSEGELDRVLADAQMSRGELDAVIANYPASAHRLEEMAARLGVADALHRDREIERDLQHVCSVCVDQGRCRRWLASGAKEGFEAFCPNAETLKALRRANN